VKNHQLLVLLLLQKNESKKLKQQQLKSQQKLSQNNYFVKFPPYDAEDFFYLQIDIVIVWMIFSPDMIRKETYHAYYNTTKSKDDVS
jgi:hypothetical protein